ncbi:MAG: transporter substrate-binding domain-containing protein [Dictyoglomus thermophilum]|nr:transporter substrate-binding domain-containing protein [Dictyoglomus thermophilum]
MCEKMKFKGFKNFLILLLLIPLLVSFNANAQDSLKILIDKDYPPFTYIDEKGNLVGISVEFWNLWSKKTGVKVELFPMEWEKAQESLVKGNFDAIDTIFKTSEREKYLVFSKPIFEITSSIYYRVGMPKIYSPKDLTPYVVGVKKGDAVIELTLKENPHVSFKYFDNYSDIIKSAKKGDISVFIMDDIPANYYLVKYDLVYEFVKGPLITTNYLHVATLKNKGELIDLINRTLDKITKEELAELTERYVVSKKAEKTWFEKNVRYILIFILVLGFFAFLYFTLLSREIRRVRQALEEWIEKFWGFFKDISEISNLNLRDEEFLRKVLDIIIGIISKANYGSIFLKEGNDLKLIATLGHDKNLEGIILGEGNYLGPDKPIIVKDLLNIERKDEKVKEILLKYSKPTKESLIVPLKLDGNIWGYFCLDISKESKESFDELDISLVEQFTNIISVFYGFRNYLKEREIYLTNLITVLIKTLEYYDRYTQGHSERVARYAVKIAERIGLDKERIKKIYWASLVHDIGKIYIPQTLLNKNGKFTEDEYEFVKIHPVKSEEILSQVEELKELARIVRHHHERWDGKGYPDGLSAEEIPLESRIIAVADAFEAMTAERPYKRALTLEEAIEEIERNKGTQFDPRLAEVMIEIIKEEIQKKS